MARKKKEEEIVEDTSRIIEGNIEEVLHNAMIPYSEHVILDRALPRVEDGLKPVQRRILYTMLELGITPDKPHRKSARIVGDCLGKYHPHGDMSVYEAMVRLAQPYNTRMVLIDGHGNFGSVDGDSAAAMRYTEARLTPLSLELLRDLDKDTVPMSLNFDDSLEEPDILPGRFPNLLVNGATGIAVGLSTSIPPHNLSEVIDGVVAYIDNKNITLDEMMQIIPGPDFPTGGEIVPSEDIKEAYRTGKGRVIMRAKIEEEKDGNKVNLVITEIPYQIKKAALLQNINLLRETKKDIFGVITDIVDESDRNGMRCVIKLKAGTDPKMMRLALLKASKLETSFSMNMVAIAEGKPQQLGLLDIISYYVEYQRNIIYRRSQYDLAAAKKREHILEGLLIAVNNIREVVEIVLNSKSYQESRDTLRERFDLTDKQAVAVLDIPLKRLNKLDVHKMEEELAELRSRIKELEAVINSKHKQLSIVRKEILEIKKKYGEPRKSKFIDSAGGDPSAVDLTVKLEKRGVLLLNYEGDIRFMTDKSYQMASKSIVNSQAKQLVRKALKCSSKDNILAFTNKGNCVVFNIEGLGEDKWKSRGTSISKISKAVSDEKIVQIYLPKDIKGKELYFYTKNGMVKKSLAEEYPSDKKTLYPAMGLKEDDLVIEVEIRNTKDEYIYFITEQGMVLNAEADIPVQGRKAGGVKGIMLAPKDHVYAVGQNDNAGELVVILDSGYAKRVILPSIEPTKRFRKGVKLSEIKNGNLVYCGLVQEPYEIAVASMNGDCTPINTEDISIENRTSKGKNILKGAAKNVETLFVIAQCLKHNLI